VAPISIRSKILIVLSTVLVSAVGLYLYLASQLFFEDKKLLVYELNQTNVRTLGEEVETYFKRVLDKIQIVASLRDQGSSALATVLPQLISEDEGFLRVAIVNSQGEGTNTTFKTTVLGTWAKPLELVNKDATYLDKLRDQFPIPFDRVLKNSVWIRNATPPASAGEETPAIITLASRVSDNEVVYADLKLDPLLSTFTRTGLAQTYLMDSDGFALADSDQKKISTTTDLKTDFLMASAQTSKLRSEVKSYSDNGIDYLGSFYRLGIASLVVASKIQAGEAFAAAQVLMRKSLLYALVVVTLAFLISLFLSHSLTTPIRRLVEATQRIAQGDFSISLPTKSGDELAILSASFNSMNTNLKTSYDQIQEYSHNLENKVAERTVQLEKQNVAIKEAQEALLRTTRLASVGEVAGRAAHEVLNPLTNILTRLEKLQRQLQNEESQDFSLFSEIISAWQKSLTEGGADGLLKSLSGPSQAHAGKNLLEEDILNLVALATDFSKRGTTRQTDLDFLMKESQRITKIVNGMRQLTRVTGARKNLSAHQTIQESISTMKDVLAKNKIAVETNFCSENPTIQADSDEILQVFSNLMRNAMQAFHGAQTEGGVAKKITFTTNVITHGESHKLQIRVSDNGPGIAQEYQSMIFEPTFTTKSIEEGTGLGLAICRRFLRGYDGEILLEKSQPNNTVFLIELPEVSSQVSGGAA